MPPRWGPLLERSPIRKTQAPSPSAADPAGSPARWKEQQARESLVSSITDRPFGHRRAACKKRGETELMGNSA